jgi:hypothetical protein
MKREPLDSADLDALQELERSPAYALVVERIEIELERAGQACEREVLDVHVRRAQGAAAALRTVLRIPAILKDEIKNSLTE